MEMKNFEKDFVLRTSMILKNPSLCEKFDVTFLLNCLLGLLNFPIEKHKSTTDEYQNENLNFRKACMNYLKNNNITFKDGQNMPLKKYPQRGVVFKGIRNAISHDDIKVECTNNSGEISWIELTIRKYKTKNIAFIIGFTPKQLYDFALFMSDQYFEIFHDYLLEKDEYNALHSESPSQFHYSYL